VIIPQLVSHEKQRDLVRWALRDHARPPNETNLDTHYLLPASGLWSAATNESSRSTLISPRATAISSSTSTSTSPAQPSRRTLVSNDAASPETFAVLLATPKLPAPPSTSLAPIPAFELVKKLRWANIGWYYHWGTKQYDFSRVKVPVDEQVAWLCKEAVR
jgi:alkylated DNA repair protein alkB family protein 1